MLSASDHTDASGQPASRDGSDPVTSELSEKVAGHSRDIAVLENSMEEVRRTVEKRSNWSIATTIVATLSIMGFVKGYATEGVTQRVATLETVSASDHHRINDACAEIAVIKATLRMNKLSASLQTPWGSLDEMP